MLVANCQAMALGHHEIVFSFVHRYANSVAHSLRSMDTDTVTGIRHGGTRGHGKFKKIRIRIRQGHGIIR